MKTILEDTPQSDCRDSSIEEAMNDALKRAEDNFQAAKEAVSDTLDRGERWLSRSRNTAEGYLEEITHQVRRNPMATVGLFFAAGAIAGGVFALMSPRRKAETGNSRQEAL